jgi:hypothetical protein
LGGHASNYVEIQHFVCVTWPVCGLPRGEVLQVLVAHRLEKFSTFCCRESGPPERVFGVKVASGYEPITKRLEEIFVLSEFGVMLGGDSKLQG